MKSDGNGLPHCGEGSRLLGVRAGIDIPVDHRECVKPKTGGMSVFSDPGHLPKHRKPAWMFGGEGRDPLFVLADVLLPCDLVTTEEGTIKHYLIEPFVECPYSRYASALYHTCEHWQEVPCTAL